MLVSRGLDVCDRVLIKTLLNVFHGKVNFQEIINIFQGKKKKVERRGT